MMNNLYTKPPRLKKGDRIGIITPAGPVKPEALKAGIRKWESLGFQVVEGGSLHQSRGYFAGTDEERAAELNAFLRDPDIAAIVCARGGYGTMRIARMIDWQAAKARPRILMGFSDITFLLNAWQEETGSVVFHGPSAATAGFIEQDEGNDRFLLNLLTNPEADLSISGGDLATHRKGRATGILTGGCLSLVHLSIGTPWEFSSEGKVLFLEDQNEPPYRIDRMLTHLFLAGKLDGITALVFGHLGMPFDKIAPIVDELLSGVDIPVLYGVPAGHGKINMPLPLGLSVEVDASIPHIRFLSGAVS